LHGCPPAIDHFAVVHPLLDILFLLLLVVVVVVVVACPLIPLLLLLHGHSGDNPALDLADQADVGVVRDHLE
jgi:hypothetical protein